MQDNASCHTDETIQKQFEDHDKEFKVLPGPPNSPDINSIEHLCWTNKINPWRLHLSTYVLVSDVPGHAQGSRGVHASMHQSCFGSTKGTYMIIKQLGSHNYVVRRIQIILVGAKWWYTFYTTRFVFLTPPLQNDKQRRRFGCAFALFLITLMKLL